MPDQRFDEGLTLQTPALVTFYVGQFQLIWKTYLSCNSPLRRSSIVSLGIYPHNSRISELTKLRFLWEEKAPVTQVKWVDT